jgi:hypothetical protein
MAKIRTMPAERIPVCIFAKPPVAGKVKTRLIPAFGAQAAAELASAMLRDVWAAVSACPQLRPVLASAAEGEFPVPVPDGDLWLQPAGDLGQRIETILCKGLLHAPVAIAIGADTPLLGSGHLIAAVRSLHMNDAVLGPAADGGFYLLGLSRCPAGLLRALPWSTPLTFAATRTRLLSNGFRLAELDALSDVDTPQDVQALTEALRQYPHLAPATRACLARYVSYAD